jgi:hypothetical protein
MVKVTAEFIHSGKVGPGGWCAAQLRMLGISWPPKSGWIESVASKNIELTDEAAELFVGYGKGEVSKTKIRKHNRKARRGNRRAKKTTPSNPPLVDLILGGSE